MWNKYFIAIKTARKLEKEIGILYSMFKYCFQGTLYISKKRNIIEDDQKVEETNNKNDDNMSGSILWTVGRVVT